MAALSQLVFFHDFPFFLFALALTETLSFLLRIFSSPRSLLPLRLSSKMNSILDDGRKTREVPAPFLHSFFPSILDTLLPALSDCRLSPLCLFSPLPFGFRTRVDVARLPLISSPVLSLWHPPLPPAPNLLGSGVGVRPLSTCFPPSDLFSSSLP